MLKVLSPTASNMKITHQVFKYTVSVLGTPITDPSARPSVSVLKIKQLRSRLGGWLSYSGVWLTVQDRGFKCLRVFRQNE